MSSAGTTSTRALTGAPLRFAKRCTRPAGTTTVSPGPATIFFAPRRNVISPSRTWKRSSCSGWTWAPGTWPSAVSVSSNSSRSPPVSAEVARNSIVSPETGFWMICPV